MVVTSEVDDELPHLGECASFFLKLTSLYGTEVFDADIAGNSRSPISIAFSLNSSSLNLL